MVKISDWASSKMNKTKPSQPPVSQSAPSSTQSTSGAIPKTIPSKPQKQAITPLNILPVLLYVGMVNRKRNLITSFEPEAQFIVHSDRCEHATPFAMRPDCYAESSDLQLFTDFISSSVLTSDQIVSGCPECVRSIQPKKSKPNCYIGDKRGKNEVAVGGQIFTYRDVDIVIEHTDSVNPKFEHVFLELVRMMDAHRVYAFDSLYKPANLPLANVFVCEHVYDVEEKTDCFETECANVDEESFYEEEEDVEELTRKLTELRAAPPSIEVSEPEPEIYIPSDDEDEEETMPQTEVGPILDGTIKMDQGNPNDVITAPSKQTLDYELVISSSVIFLNNTLIDSLPPTHYIHLLVSLFTASLKFLKPQLQKYQTIKVSSMGEREAEYTFQCETVSIFKQTQKCVDLRLVVAGLMKALELEQCVTDIHSIQLYDDNSIIITS